MSTPLPPRTVNRLRIAAALLGVAFAGAVIAVVVFLPGGDRSAPPPEIVAVTPADGAVATGTEVLAIQLADGVTATVFLDGLVLEMEVQGPVLRWQPAPGERFEMWPRGAHTVEVRFSGESEGVYRFGFSGP